MNDSSNDFESLGSAGSQTELAQQRLQFVTNLYVSIKNSRIFETHNEAVIKSIKNLLTFIHSIFETDGMLTIKIMHNSLFINDKRMKSTLSIMSCYNSVLAELQRLKIGSISFEKDIKEEDLIRFIYILSEFKPETQDVFREFLSKIVSADVQGIFMEPEVKGENDIVNGDIKERSQNVYFKSISLAREVLTQAQKFRAINFKKTKRIIQNMIDLTMENDRFLLSLAAIKNHDEYTFNHSANVCVISISFGQRLGLSKLDQEMLGIGALFHDAGKIFIPREILNKPGKLTEDEWKTMKSHPEKGVKSLLRIHIANDMLCSALLIAYEHHQRLDLTGYPEAKEKREQNLLSKIISIADCYDAMTTPRVYRKYAMKPPDAFRIMIKDSGKAFDPELLKLFISNIGLYPIGSLVKLNSGEIGLVHSINHQFQYIDRPIVKVISASDMDLIKNVIDLTQKDDATGKYKYDVIDCFTPSEHFEDLTEYLNLI